MTAGPLVSVLTPVYNGEAYLSECIESVRAQTYQRWEHVLVDNVSTDATAEILRTWQISADSRWCKFLSADDLLMPECLDRMVSLGEAHPRSGSSAPIRCKAPRSG